MDGHTARDRLIGSRDRPLDEASQQIVYIAYILPTCHTLGAEHFCH